PDRQGQSRPADPRDSGPAPTPQADRQPGHPQRRLAGEGRRRLPSLQHGPARGRHPDLRSLHPAWRDQDDRIHRRRDRRQAGGGGGPEQHRGEAGGFDAAPSARHRDDLPLQDEGPAGRVPRGRDPGRRHRQAPVRNGGHGAGGRRGRGRGGESDGGREVRRRRGLRGGEPEGGMDVAGPWRGRADDHRDAAPEYFGIRAAGRGKDERALTQVGVRRLREVLESSEFVTTVEYTTPKGTDMYPSLHNAKAMVTK